MKSLSGRSLGLVLPTFPQNGEGKWGELGRVAAEAEAAGADALWAADHLFWGGPVLECFTALGVAAAATSSCVIGTAVLQLPLRRTAAVAKTCASLQAVSTGRLILGVGSGIHEGEYEAVGADFASRGATLDAGIDELRRHWSPGQGRYEQLPQPEAVPIWIGGSKGPVLRRVARRGDGWIPLFVPPERLRDDIDRLRGEIEAAGRDPGAVVRACMVFVSVGENEAATDRGTAWMGSLYDLPPERFTRHLVAGEPAACADRLRAYFDAGIQHLALFVADDDPLSQWAALREEMAAVMSP